MSLLTLSQDALVWNISPFGLKYRVNLREVNMVEKFAALAMLWECSKVASVVDTANIERALMGHVSTLAACQWDDDDVAFTEIDMLTSTFALFHISC